MNLINPVYALITASLGRNIFYADGTYISILKKLKQGAVPQAPEEAYDVAIKALKEIRGEV